MHGYKWPINCTRTRRYGVGLQLHELLLCVRSCTNHQGMHFFCSVTIGSALVGAITTADGNRAGAGAGASKLSTERNVEIELHIVYFKFTLICFTQTSTRHGPPDCSCEWPPTFEWPSTAAVCGWVHRMPARPSSYSPPSRSQLAPQHAADTIIQTDEHFLIQISRHPLRVALGP